MSASDRPPGSEWLGTQADYPEDYNPDLLSLISRSAYRDGALATSMTQCSGYDTWYCHEVSCLLESGKPCNAVLRVQIPHSSEHIVESKSLKLYLFSLNQLRVENIDALQALIQRDLSERLGEDTQCALLRIDPSEPVSGAAVCLDELDVNCSEYSPSAGLLNSAGADVVSELLCSHLLRSRCPVTQQPDWASVFIGYKGSAICHESPLRYLISYREHDGFHEQIVERIYSDLASQFAPTSLWVSASFLRRGGIDITPLRESQPGLGHVSRAWRQ